MARRMRVEGRDAGVVAAIGVVAGVLAVLAGAEPTGSTVIDAVLVFAATLGCVWAAASAPWWASVVAAGVSLAFAPSLLLIAIGLIPFMGGMAIGSTRRSLPWSRALAAALAIQVFARLGNVVFFGFSALLTLVVLTALAVLGVQRRPRRERARVIVGAGVLGGVFVLALIGFAVAGSSARPDVQNGNRAARDALQLLRSGDITGAREAFDRASTQFHRADDRLGSFWSQPARLVPLAGRYRSTATELVAGAAKATDAIKRALASIDYDKLRVVNGAIDLDAVRGLAQPLADLDAALDEFTGTIAGSRDRWLPSSLLDRLDDVDVDLAKAKVDLTNARAAVAQAPDMLGAKDKRVYFVAFTTPAEARGLGGFMGNWAEVTIDEGRISVTDFGRTADLRGGKSVKRLESPTPFFVAQYGDFLYSDEDTKTAGPDVWSNITVSPDFPSTASMIAELYPQSGGKQLDGVFSLDVYALAQLMEITGPVQLEDGTTIDSSNAVQYLLKDQYLTDDNAARIDSLEKAAQTSITSLLTSTLPSPPALGEMFSPLARQHRLMAWALRPAEQDVFVRSNMAGALPDRAGGDSFGFAFNNGAASKIDSFLEGEATYAVTVDEAAGTVNGTATLTLRNEAPASGLPDYVIGNQVGAPNGTNRIQVMIATALPAKGMLVDGQPVVSDTASEGDTIVTSAFIDIPPGGQVVVTVPVEGPFAAGADYRLVVRSPATVNPMPIDVSINGAPAETVLADAGVARVSTPG